MSAKIHEKSRRAGGDCRGSSADRRARKFKMLRDPRWGGCGSLLRKIPCVHGCGRHLSFGQLEQDRIVPGSDGGRYVYANLQPACRGCNLARTDNPEWRYGA